eukprot:12651030-Ditylum_brightwellii.AAC.1
MYGSVLHVQCHNAVASAVLVHEQVHGKVLNEVGGVKGEGAAVQGVEHGVSCAIGRTGTAVGLAAFAILEGLASEGALVDFSVFRAAEGKAEFFQLQHCLWRFSAPFLQFDSLNFESASHGNNNGNNKNNSH